MDYLKFDVKTIVYQYNPINGRVKRRLGVMYKEERAKVVIDENAVKENGKGELVDLYV